MKKDGMHSSKVETCDGFGRLASFTGAQVSRPVNATCQYDSIGNRTQSSGGVPAVLSGYAANALNQYTSVTDNPVNPVNPVYDSDGNMTSDGTFRYAWDAEIKRAQSTSRRRRAAAILRLARGRASARARSGIPRHSGNCYRLIAVSNATGTAFVSSYTYDHLGRRGTKSCFGTTYTALFFTWLGRIPTQQIKIQLPRLGYGCSEKLQEILQRP